MTQQEPGGDRLADQVTRRAATDQQFRQDLLNNPKQALQQGMGIQIPDNVNVQVIEETPNSFVLVLPPAPRAAGQELSSSDLDAVAGGWSGGGTNCGTCGGADCAGDITQAICTNVGCK